MNEVRQRNVALTWVVPVSIVLLVVVAACVVPLVPGRYSLGRFALVLPFLALALFGGVQPLLWWWGADLRLDQRGLGFGTDRPRSRPAQVTFTARNPWLVPWEEVTGVRLVRSRAAVASMRKAARPTGRPQPTYWGGYFPARGRAALLLDVDPSRLALPEIKPPSTRRRAPGSIPGAAMRTSTLWVFPVRHVGSVLEALQGRGVVVTESDRAEVPREPGEAARSDEQELTVSYARQKLTENLGRPPTEAELAEILDTMDRPPEQPR